MTKAERLALLVLVKHFKYVCEEQMRVLLATPAFGAAPMVDWVAQGDLQDVVEAFREEGVEI